MTTDRQAWWTLHPESHADRPHAACSCGQELDTCTGRHCPRCGATIPARAA